MLVLVGFYPYLHVGMPLDFMCSSIVWTIEEHLIEVVSCPVCLFIFYNPSLLQLDHIISCFSVLAIAVVNLPPSLTSSCRYLKSSFIIDLLGCMPWDLIYKVFLQFSLSLLFKEEHNSNVFGFKFPISNLSIISLIIDWYYILVGLIERTSCHKISSMV